MKVFNTLNGIDVSSHTEDKNGLTYLSWAWAWSEVKKHYPMAQYKVYENAEGWNYFTDGRTAWVKTGVTIEELEHIEYLPVLDFRNKSIALEAITSFNVNTAIQRSLTKAIARHGLGLYIYAGEDLPENTYVSWSKATAQNKKDYWLEYKDYLETNDVEVTTFNEWLEIADDQQKMFNGIVKFLKDKTLFDDQIESYKKSL